MIKLLEKSIREILPVNNFLFNKNKISNKKKLFFLKEIIREKILRTYEKEIPYSVQINIESIREFQNIVFINVITLPI